MLLANAADPQAAMQCFEKEWGLLIAAIESGLPGAVDHQLDRSAENLKRIDLKRPVGAVPVISLVGEIFVRRDGISRQYLTERLAQAGFACTCAPVAEWIHYTDWLLTQGFTSNGRATLWQKMGLAFKRHNMRKIETRVIQKLAFSGLIRNHMVDISEIIRHAHPHVAPDHMGEAILTVGSALHEVASTACGVIAIGPFGCMPNRMAESILNEVMTATDKLKATPGDRRLRAMLTGMEALPFLAIESDGSPFPQIIEAKLEAFCLRAGQLHERMQAAGTTRGPGGDAGL
jgi:predicted nucleotide-binding protein (sugar kinase/HSP70/actin superfamily)